MEPASGSFDEHTDYIGPRRDLAKPLSYDQGVCLVRICCQNKEIYALDHNTMVFSMTVVNGFKEEAKLVLDTDYGWQTAQRRVTRLVKERQSQRQVKETGQTAEQDRDLKDALDE